MSESSSPVGQVAAGTRLLALLYAIPFVYMTGYFFPPTNHDVATLIHVGRRWLSGEQLYLDVIDVNLPLTVMLHTVPVLLERVSGLAATSWWVVLTMIALLGCVLACRRITALAAPGAGHVMREVLPLTVLVVLTIIPGHEFGQREHLMMMAGLPYALLAGVRAVRPVPRALGVVIALAAGIGFALKPHYLVIPALIEGYLLLRRGLPETLRDPVPWLIAACVVLHAAIIVLLTPAYLSYTYPIAVGAYLAIGDGPLRVLLGPTMAATAVMLAILIPFAFQPGREAWFATLCLFAIGGVVSCVAQGKGWPYHTMPAAGGTLILLGALISAQVDSVATAGTQPRRVVTLTASLLALIAYPYFLVNPPFAYQSRYGTSTAYQLGEIIAAEAPSRRVMAFSPGIYPFFPTIEYQKAYFAGRFTTMWAIQGLYATCLPEGRRYRDPDAAPPLEKQVVAAIVDDFARADPELLVFDREPGIPFCGGEEFDYRAYFSREPRFAAALARYEFVSAFERYDIWRRRRGVQAK